MARPLVSKAAPALVVSHDAGFARVAYTRRHLPGDTPPFATETAKAGDSALTTPPTSSTAKARDSALTTPPNPSTAKARDPALTTPPTPPSQGGESKVARGSPFPPLRRGGQGGWRGAVRASETSLAAASNLAAAEPPASASRVHVEGDRAGGLDLRSRAWIRQPSPGSTEENATPARWASLCGIFVRPDDASSGSLDITLTGSYRVRGTTLQFVSRYPLDQPGYRVRIDRSLLTAADLRRLAEDAAG